MNKALLTSGWLFWTTLVLHAQMPSIQSITASDTTVAQYAKLELALNLEATFDNPYDYDQISVRGYFIGPDGAEKVVDGFYMEEFELNTDNGALNSLMEAEGFKIRFAPDQIGNWTYRVEVTDEQGAVSSDIQSFSCTAGTHKGYVRANQTNYLQFDNGAAYIPIGENIAWQNGNAFTDYQSWLTGLSDNGGNFFRLWHAHWGLGIEWRNNWNGFSGLRQYKETNMAYQDWLFDFCAERDIYVMLCIQHHGPVSTQVNPNWNDSPYNVANGGPCQNTWDFFTNETARAHTKNRLRYIVARWGYARSIMAWELFNEVNWTDNFQQNKSLVADWHLEMSAYLKSIDPYGHLVTTSYADEDEDPMVWAAPDIDLTQTHYYLNVAQIEKALVNGIDTYLHDFGKPTLTGEFGLGGSPVLANADPDGIHIHNAMWATLFGGGLGTAMSWWWDSYIHPGDLYYHFAPMATVAGQVPFIERDLRPATSYVIGAAGDLALSPTLGWSGIGEDTITIDEKGQLSPSNANLGSFLYGSQWNTQFRSPPTFVVNYPEAGTFTVNTNAEAGIDPRIAIYVNGEQVIEQSANTGTSYTIDIAAGSHTITVDNTGTDWIAIASYVFSGLGSKIDTYTLRSDDGAFVAGWLLNQEYNHIQVVEQGVPDPAVGGVLQVEDVVDGAYAVVWYDCISGELVGNESAVAENGQLQIALPDLYWDLAFVAEGMTTNTREQQVPVTFEVFPNPVKAGGSLQIRWDDTDEQQLQYQLYNAEGKRLRGGLLNGLSTSLEPAITAGLPAGLYWLQVSGAGRMGSRPFVVVP